MKQRHWVIAERLNSDLKQHLLLSRLDNTDYTPEQFFNPSLVDLSSPHDFEGMEAAVVRIMQAIHDKESIVVWGDFDADGVTSTAILWETLHQLGANVLPYIPNRDVEGHGFSEVGVKKLVEDGVQLVITVDHGITAVDDVETLRQEGIDAIITDHHEPRLQGARNQADENAERQSKIDTLHPQAEEFVLPEAVAIVHPLLMDMPQPFAGCGVAYMLAYAVWLAEKGVEDSEIARQGFAQDKIELAAIGTVADMVPLQADNRILAAMGLQQMTQSKRPGLQQMYRLAGMDTKDKFGAYEIGFGIGPRLNAPGRLGDALESLRLLCTKDVARAARLANDLNDLNKQRQDLLAQVAEEAKAEVLKHEDGVYVLAKPNWPAGVCGLAAGKIVESFYRPTVVMERMGELSRGSARSIAGFDFTAALTTIADLLESYGGHAMAAGFVAKTENLPTIEQRLTELLWQQFDKESLSPQLQIDAEVSLDELNWDLHAYICQFEPFGMGNPKPVFVSRGLKLTEMRGVGDGKHLKLAVKGIRDESLTTFNGIAFGMGYLTEKLELGSTVDMVYQLDENVWQNKRSLQLMVKDIRQTSNED